MTSTSIVTIFPSKVIGKAMKIPYNEKYHPSKAVRIVVDGVMGGEPRAFQQDMDIKLLHDHDLNLKSKLMG